MIYTEIGRIFLDVESMPHSSVILGIRLLGKELPRVAFIMVTTQAKTIWFLRAFEKLYGLSGSFGSHVAIVMSSSVPDDEVDSLPAL
jgi:hypothetical protein